MGERGSKSVSAQASVPHSASLEPDGGVRKIKPISIRDAIDVRRQGGDVVVSGGDMASNRELARMIEEQASGRWKRCPPHANAGRHALPHYQPEVRGPTGHTFYETTNRQARG